jgi:CRP/FNR family transcriptional regulator, anaerobic regulatory protein
MNEFSALKDIKDAVLRQEFADIGTVKTFKNGDIVQMEGAYIRMIPIILRGRMKVVQHDDEGREMLLYYLTEGESCIMSILGSLNNETSKVKVIVEENADVLMIPMKNASLWVRKYPAWTDFIFKLYQRRFEELLEVVQKISSKSVSERLSDLLKTKVQMSKSNRLTITHQQLADEIGTSRVVVSRVLKGMENHGNIKLGRNVIEML